MKYALSCLVLIGGIVILIFLPAAVQARPLQPEGIELQNTRWVEVRADPQYRPARISAPESFLGIQSVTAQFTINYLSGSYNGDLCTTWPEQAKTAFSYAANIWGTLLSSPVPIVIDACWASNLRPEVLGRSGAISYKTNFTNAPLPNVWYPIALANALSGSDLVGDKADIYIAFNSTYSWYFGIDGNTPPTQYDFVSVVLHEIAHGLGFSGSMWYGTECGGFNYGCWGYSGYPDAYDTFMQNGSGERLLDTSLFPNPSFKLGSQLTGNNLFFNGNNAKAANGGSPPKMYAPTSWQPGSSYAHLDYNTFKDTPHRLMVYAISSGASIHNPGSITLGILQDLGWNLSNSNLTQKVFLPLTLKTLAKPQTGYWQTADSSRYFYVSLDQANVLRYTIFITLTQGPCSGQTWEVWKTSPLPIAGNQFSFGGQLNGNGTFTSPTTATVIDQLTNLDLGQCGIVNGGPWTSTFTWQNSSQPTSDQMSGLDEAIQAVGGTPPSVEVFYTP